MQPSIRGVRLLRSNDMADIYYRHDSIKQVTLPSAVRQATAKPLPQPNITYNRDKYYFIITCNEVVQLNSRTPFFSLPRRGRLQGTFLIVDGAMDGTSRKIAEIQSQMDALLERMIALLYPGATDGTDRTVALSTIQLRTLHLLAAGVLIEDPRPHIAEAALRWLQLAATLVRTDAACAPHFLPDSPGVFASCPE
jgi:hypothetical protein